MEYPNLIECTLQCSKLAEAIEKMAGDSGMLNLVCPDWEAKLDAYPVHQRHLKKEVAFSKGHLCSDDKSYLRNIAIQKNSYKIIVLGRFGCTRTKPKTPDGPPGDLYFVARDCPPLTHIAEAMKESPSHKLHDGANLFMEYCNPNLCISCADAHKTNGVYVDVNRNWCVLSTRKYDGNMITNDFKALLAPVLESVGNFLAIAQLHIFSRTTFGEEKYKIGGKIKNIIVFQETAIQPRISLVFSKTLSLPSIEFPKEEKEDEDFDKVVDVC